MPAIGLGMFAALANVFGFGLTMAILVVVCCGWLSCFACFCERQYFHGVCQHTTAVVRSRYRRGSGCVAWGSARFSLPRLFTLVCLMRIGEALHPGPACEDSWTCGVFNPSGLSTKIDYTSQIPLNLMLGSETHLTRSGLARLRSGFRAQQSPFKYVVAGAPCNQRVQPDAGSYAGVIALSTFPTRSLPHSMDSDLYNTARLMVCGVAIRHTWLQCGVAYGFPHSVQHKHRTYRTECLLDELILRIGHQATGPRIICGDFNHPASGLQQTERLQQLGFREAQSVAKWLWNYEPQPTSTGPHLIDQVWLSAELLPFLSDVQVNWDHWSSHATVVCTFRHVGSELMRPLWNLPASFPWPSDWSPNLSVDWSNPSVGYASWWFQLESQAAAVSNAPISKASFGRGRTLEVVHRKPFLAPSKLGRPGDLQPEFFGESLQHVRWFKQLRRIHSLSRMLHASSAQPAHHVKTVELWGAIRHAVGFPSGFGAWWMSTFGSPFSEFLPVALPSVDQVDATLEVFRVAVRKLELKLGAGRLQAAKHKRSLDANLVFKDCVRDSPAPVDTLISSQELRVEEVHHADFSVVFPEPVRLDESLPLIVHGRSIPIINSCHDQVWLESTEGIVVGDVLRQDRILSTDQGILDEFSSVWRDRWVKMDHVLPGQWTQISDFCRREFAPIPWTFPSLTVSQLQDALCRKKKRAATGPDGVSRQDLLSLPACAISPLLGLYEHLEQGQPWPTQLVQGFVNCLDKQRGDGGVDSYRPIVIYPLATRLWSTIRAKQALLSIGPFLPGGLHGGVPKKQAKSIWFQLAQRLESAHFLGESLLGVAVDIQRAFNNLPREPIFCAAVQLGLPRHLLVPWASFLAQQSRRFKLRGVVGSSIPSTSGFPEGCAWSVFAMAIADWMLTRWLECQLASPHEALTFVDDWRIIFLDPNIFDEVWQVLLRFVSSLHLTLDLAKSYCWSAQAADRKKLLHRPVCSLLAARDLGAHQNFSLKSGNRTLQVRLQAMADLWPKLRKSLAPYDAKLRVLCQLAWPRSLHAISVVHLGSSHYATLRTGAMVGLGVNRIGANPVLRLMQHGVLCDPEAWAIVQTVREAREVGILEQLEAMLDFHSRGCPTPPNGPCAILVSRLCRLGWSLCPGGQFCDVFGKLDVLRMSFSAFVARVQWSWPRVAATAVAHRASFAGIQFADISATRQTLLGLGDTDKKFLQCCLDGTMYQDLSKTKAQRGSQSKCLFCNQLDSIHHRVWECPHFEPCRASCRFRSVIDLLPPALTCHGWPLVPAAWYDLCGHFLRVPPVDVAVVWPAEPSCIHHLFIDGTCHSPAEPRLRYAAWGVTLASAGVGSLDHRILACGHVQGLEQTSYRGELLAMVYALKVVSQGNVRAVIWSDCSSVVRKTMKVLAGRRVAANKPHSDLWAQIEEMVAAGTLEHVQVQKVVSHCPVHTAVDDIEAWAFWHNQLVDHAVGSFNQRRTDDFWSTWNQVRASMAFGRLVHSEVVSVLLQVARLAQSGNKPAPSPEPPAEEVEVFPIAPIGAWSYGKKLLRMYRSENVEQVHQWWGAIGVPALSSRGPMRWVSGAQLWADFTLETGWRGPISPKFGQWYLGPDDVPADTPCHLDARLKSFLRLWRAYVKFNNFVVPSRVMRPHSYALAFWALCFRLPWPDSRLRRVDDAFFKLGQRQIAKPNVLSNFWSLELPEEASTG